METNLKKSTFEEFKACAEQRLSLSQNRKEVDGEYTDSYVKLSEMARELLKDVTAEDLRRLIFASLSEEHKQSDLYGSGELMPVLSENIVVADWWSDEPFPLAYCIFRLAHLPWGQGSLWRAHLHVSLHAIEQLNYTGRSRSVKTSVCHNCVRDFTCSSGKICVVIEGQVDQVARAVIFAVENGFAPVTALETLEKLDSSAEALDIKFKKYHVVREYKSEKTYEVLASSHDNALRLVNESLLTSGSTPISESDLTFHGERVYCVDEEAAF
jgi:hypothetical protein